jgi:hypothetical protein
VGWLPAGCGGWPGVAGVVGLGWHGLGMGETVEEAG